MLTTDIKQKIDNARNILVGKIPTPTGQVEQITLALVYKFMNDIDEQNKELGGELKFFTGQYSKYAWKHLLDKSLSAYERVTAYGEGLEKMHLNPNLPQFFRNVFKGAFLPFRDPEVLTIFLKQIDEFKYGHNGDLGDAFEYLLQVMGTQGDAGQFLTPRHIINFIVDIVDPLKTDKTLDPAEGTAGFLISTFLHILKNNTKPGSNLPGSALTYDERKKLSENLVGYDISHDMVRLSLVNLYLHGFADPKIYEYDTLGNLDRWDDDFDCILTNPPFMTPKGGVKPHKRFSIQAKKSEVLFVDYIMEHLNPNGKAGIIVPEGIIFQSATAYKALRKMMVDQKFLYAVVSLPSGIFQPYSGVKTSVLFMDRVLAKNTKDILFVKIENDGFDLGAQRRPIDKNDLPQAEEILKRYKLWLQSGKQFELSDEEKKMANLVPIEKISKSGDYNLSGDRYRLNNIIINTQWPMEEIGNICTLINGRAFKPTDWEKEERGGLPIIRIQNLNNEGADYNYYSGDVEEKLLINKGDLLFSWSGSRGTSFGPHIWRKDRGILNQHIFRVQHSELVNRQFFYYMLKEAVHEVEENLHGGVGLVHITKGNLEKIKIPLPPLEIQQEIVSQLDSYQKIIDGAKQVVENYKPEINIDPSWEMVELNEVCDVRDGTHDSPKYHLDGYPLITSKNIINGKIDFTDVNLISKEDLDTINKRSFVDDGDIIMPMIGTIGNPIVVKKDREFGIKNVALIKFYKDSVIDRFFLKNILDSDIFNRNYKNSSSGSTQKFISLGFIRSLKIPLPPLDVQKQIVSRIEEEQKIVEANKKLIELYQGKIKEKIDEVWGK